MCRANLLHSLSLMSLGTAFARLIARRPRRSFGVDMTSFLKEEMVLVGASIGICLLGRIFGGDVT